MFPMDKGSSSTAVPDSFNSHKASILHSISGRSRRLEQHPRSNRLKDLNLRLLGRIWSLEHAKKLNVERYFKDPTESCTLTTLSQYVTSNSFKLWVLERSGISVK
ncbi:hypothetical protein CIPAW_15G169300 [Carya illinoinensis]|uniref:Uncharacterized protein n=1 Tax=Carya illinoinensis TaxID=32201 RepID=A0A8T1NGJ6_CARIL|nr:hypothetical protein CIPAW_15G169300 [Carya illinoinensis]